MFKNGTLLLFIICLTGIASAGELTALSLPEGTSAAALSVLNNGEIELSENSPNPFNPTTAIRFALKDTGPLNLAVFNSLGQKVRVLADGPWSAGVHAVMWDGRDNTGQIVSSGMYLYRLEVGGRSEARKMLLARKKRRGNGAETQRQKRKECS